MHAAHPPHRLAEPNAADTTVRYEEINVGGSIKTRTAYQMITDAEKRGEIRLDTTIVEPPGL